MNIIEMKNAHFILFFFRLRHPGVSVEGIEQIRYLANMTVLYNNDRVKRDPFST